MATIGRSISSRAPIALLLGVALAAISCVGPSPYAGTWKGERDFQFQEGSDPALVATAKKVTLEVEPNGKFMLVDGGMPIEGHLQGDRLEVLYIADRTPPAEAAKGFTLQRTPSGILLQSPTGPVELHSAKSATRSESSP